MPGHLTNDQFQKYKKCLMLTTELLEIGDHLAECKQCRSKLGSDEERTVILEALTRDLKSAVLFGSKHLKQLASYVESVVESQRTSRKESTTTIRNRPALILPRLIGLAAILVLLGLLAAIPFQIQINYLRTQLKNKNQYEVTKTKKPLSAPSSVQKAKSKKSSLPSN
jgi:hypothetical protein